MAPAIVVLGDSLSCKGYGIDADSGTWPSILQRSLGPETSVTQCAQGRMLASVTDNTLKGNYFGCSRQLGRALNVRGDVFLICLGTNDVLRPGEGPCTASTIEDGLVRLVLQLQHCSDAVFKHEPSVFFIQPPNIIGNGSAEQRRIEVLLPALEAAAVRTETSVLPMVELTAVQKHRDGVHLAPAGASAVAAAVAEGLQKSGALTARFVLKRLPHIGLNLSVGNEYTRDDLFAKCREKDEEPRKRRRKELRDKLSDATVFEPV